MSNRRSSSQKFLHLAPKSPGELSRLTETALRMANAELKGIVSVPKREKRTLENTLEPLNRISIAIGEATHQAGLFSEVHPDKKVREAAEAATRKLADFYPKLYLMPNVYQAVKDVSPEGLDAVAKRFREKELLDFKLAGVEAAPAVRREIKKLIKRTVKVDQAFSRNIKDDVRYISVSPKELEGLPEDYVKAHQPDKQGKIRLSTQYPDYIPFIKYAQSDAARKRFAFEYSNRAWPKNESVLKELFTLRHRLANLLGYPNWADYITANKMIGSGAAIRKFLDQVAALTKKRANQDYALLLRRKQKDRPGAAEVAPWESSYYDNLLTKEVVGLDSQRVREYFPFARVKEGVLKTMGRLFGLTFRRVSASVWYKGVESFDVYQGKRLIGRFYLDLHPREGKFNHAACFEVREGIHGQQLPEAVLVCNFSRDLMGHDEVETFFHEFGHLMHFIVAGNHHWMRFSGFATEWDFVEAPSQMLESWALDLKTLRTFARHHKTGAPIPADLVAAMRKADSFGRGMWQRGQVFYAGLSYAYHSEKSPRAMNLGAIKERERRKYSMFRGIPGTHMYASFGHLGGYSAAYYTYIWSRAIAQDILAPFKKHGMYDARTARRYRDLVLAPGGTKDARQLLRDFLGREWNLKEFKRWLEE